jgi:hypothetical protein
MFTTTYCYLSRENLVCEKKYLHEVSQTFSPGLSTIFLHENAAEYPALGSGELPYFNDEFFWKGLKGVSRRRLITPQERSSMLFRGMASIFGSSRFPFT